MANYANQKTITIHRDKVEQNGKKQYLIVYSDRLDQAARTLSPIGLKLYIYLLTNKDEYEKDYSPKHFADVYGVSIESARKAPQNLIDNGYLIKGEKNKLDFYEEPQEVNKQEIEFEEETRFVKINGIKTEITFNEFYNDQHADGIADMVIESRWNQLEICKDATKGVK